MPYVRFENFESDSFKSFRKKVLGSGRLTKEDLDINDWELLESLQLTEPGYLKRAALLVFHQDPKQWASGAYIKIGMFDSDTDLRYQHEVHGPLITMPDKAMEIVYSLYFKGIISYEGIQRLESYPVPKEAFREAITNAIVHRDYSTGVPIQIRVSSDKVVIYNDCVIPPGWTVEKAITRHLSLPHNPLIAGAFFRTGQIESWGRGIKRMNESCLSWGKPIPKIEVLYNRGFSITFEIDLNSPVSFDANQDTNRDTKDTNQDTNQDTNGNTKRLLLELLTDNPYMTVREISEKMKINERNVKKNIKALKEACALERVGSTRKGCWLVIGSC